MSFLLGLPIFRGYVKFQGCIVPWFPNKHQENSLQMRLPFQLIPCQNKPSSRWDQEASRCETWSHEIKTLWHSIAIPSRELAYPTLGKGKSSSKCHFWRIWVVGSLGKDIWMFPKIVGKLPPNHPWINRVFHYFHHPFWGYHYFLEIPIPYDHF